MEPIIFFNIGWMDFYQGMDNDSVKGGGENNKTFGWGYEILNFKPFDKFYYGYVQPVISESETYLSSRILIERLGASKVDPYINGVIVVWTATDPYHGGSYIIGWYKNATVYRTYQNPPKGSRRRYKKEDIGYFTKAKVTDSTLLPKDKRIFRIPRSGAGSMGRSNVWYADKRPGFIKQVFRYIQEGILPEQPVNSITKGRARQVDPEKRILIEKTAIKIVTTHFQELGYSVTSVEKDNVGWDLEASVATKKLRIEVKGLSGKNSLAELTPNEYYHFNMEEPDYRLCIVRSALENPVLSVYSYSTDYMKWLDQDLKTLEVEILESARVY